MSDIIPVDTFDFIVFGASGDLSMRKLFPALFSRFLDGQMPDSARIIGCSLTDRTTDEFRALVKQSITKVVQSSGCSESFVEQFLAIVTYHSIDVSQAEAWEGLKQIVNASENQIKVYYLSVAPSLFSVIANGLQSVELNQGDSRLIVEKPFGHDLASAKKLDEELDAVFDEHHIYRIDHYLGKETVQNLMAFRFANRLFEPQWNKDAIDHVQITVAEDVGVGTRGRYYDGMGAMRDMVQNHLIQLLCLIAMEPPYAYTADAIREEKIKILKSLKPLAGDEALKNTRRGQYDSDSSQPAYAEEVGNPDSRCETYVAIKAEINNWRWSGVPFFLRTGKRLRNQLAEIAVVFKTPPFSVFGDIRSRIESNTVVLTLQPNEGMSLSVMTKTPGLGGLRLHSSTLDMSFNDVCHEAECGVDPYERLIMDVVRGNQTLFMSNEEVEEAWRWIDPIIEAWEESGEKPELYDPGSSGPSGALELPTSCGRRWRSI